MTCRPNLPAVVPDKAGCSDRPGEPHTVSTVVFNLTREGVSHDHASAESLVKKGLQVRMVNLSTMSDFAARQ